MEYKRLAWRSLPGSVADNAGEVLFRHAPGGTEIIVRMSFRAAAGALGASTAKIFTPTFDKMLRENISRLKQIMETGETPFIKGL